jgi:hypothetical protein
VSARARVLTLSAFAPALPTCSSPQVQGRAPDALRDLILYLGMDSICCPNTSQASLKGPFSLALVVCARRMTSAATGCVASTRQFADARADARPVSSEQVRRMRSPVAP